MNKIRYKFYREHKYISYSCNVVEQLAAKTDFRCNDELSMIKDAFEDLVTILVSHAHYEDTCLHPLLKQKNSTVYESIDEDHELLIERIAFLHNLLTQIDEARTDEEKVELGYQFYLWFRKFNGDNLLHLHEEETIILPELQRLYSDEELKKVEAATYKIMSAQELVEMIQVLFPHMNSSDWEAFLVDIKDAVPEKFEEVWNGIKSDMPKKHLHYFIEKLK